MADKPRILTDEMIAEIKAFLPRYPSKQAVTLPALHIVNEKLRYVPLRAVVEIAQLLELHPSQVQDTLTFYGYFKQDAPAGRCRLWVCRSITLEYAECLGACEHAPCVLANEKLIPSVSHQQADEFVQTVK
jgi:NADH-quinone oxidoreductase subunit E